MIANVEYRLKKSDWLHGESLAHFITKQFDDDALRWYVSHATEDELVVQAALARADCQVSSPPDCRISFMST